MAKISSTKKLVLEDYPKEVRPWLGKMIDVLNRFLEQAYFAFVQGLTIRDNLKAQVNTITISATQSYPVKISWNLNERPTAVLMGNVTDTTGALVNAHSFSWVYNNGQVEITLNGLAAREHTLTILGLV